MPTSVHNFVGAEITTDLLRPLRQSIPHGVDRHPPQSPLTGVCYSPDHGGGGLQGVGAPDPNATAQWGGGIQNKSSQYRTGEP